MKKFETPLPADQAMEGATTRPDGTRTDAEFHREAWNTSVSEATSDLNAIAEAEERLMEGQIESFAGLDIESAIKAYRHMLEKFKDSPRVPAWEMRLAELGDRKAE
ncbi:MAG: hypothetical protein WC551_06950 [Patescibacteria group bacterium]